MKLSPTMLFHRTIIALFLVINLAHFCQAQIGQAIPGSGQVIFGRVSLPDGKPAPRVPVRIEGPRSFFRETTTDDQGNYEVRNAIAGKYRVSATNPSAPEQSASAYSDTERSYANRLQVDLYLQVPLHAEQRNINAGKISAIDASVPKNARKAFEQYQKLEKENQKEKARIQLDQAIELYPSFLQALTERGNLFIQENHLSEAEKDFNSALKISPKSAPALRGLGYCLVQRQDFPKAVGILEMAYSLEPEVPMTLLLLGFANMSVEHFDEAKQCLQAALKMSPESVSRAHVYLAEIFARENSFWEAAEEVKAYLKARPDAPDAARLKELESQWSAKAQQKKR